ncbi:PI-PLC X domain-containing 1 [Hyphodiscus hymeniophilus]|uniref:PI-PLC X domain-containing 1 n=1 Tax=Hyphodiscus hymeniophilus TaxID=353542 RepID=A0A9P6VH09_9HELO|nr:PI-PLC X domain-containing 1 [Hyphodiscus hymeniophilus]
MLPSSLAAFVALISLTGLSQAVAQESNGGAGQGGSGVSSSVFLATATSISTFGSTTTQAVSTVSQAAATSSSTVASGIRLLQAQVHNSSGTLELCHTSCDLLDAGTLESFLTDIKKWMDANTNEVVTLLLVNSDNRDASAFGTVFESSGISTYSYKPTSTNLTRGPMSTWPTLQSLITANKRLITFIASVTPDSTYPYLLDEFDYVFETTFGVSSLSGFNCTPQRPSTLTSSTSAISSGYLGLLNHFTDTAEAFGISVPDITDIDTTNSASTNITGALGTNGAECETGWGSKPTFMLVDFWNVGASIETADNLNGITATGRTSVSTAELTPGSSGASSMIRDVPRLALAAIIFVAVGNFVFM